MATKQTYFKLCWTKHPDFCSWIAAVKDDNKRTDATPSTTLTTF